MAAGYFMIILPILILISSLLIPTAFSGEFSGNHYLKTICTRNYNKSSTYSNNLKNLFDDLYNNTPTSGFGMCSSGQNTTDQAFGLSLCRGSVPMEDCRACIKEARKEITNRCPSSRAAIVWYDYCYLKYSDSNFFGQIDTENKLQMWNTNNYTADPKGFKNAATGLLRGLSRIATDTTYNNYMFAGGEMLFNKSKNKNVTIYGISQCSRDLSPQNCTTCLEWAVKELPGFTENTSPIGGRTLTGSCNAGYEVYPYLN